MQANRSANRIERRTGWSSIDWRKAHRLVRHLRQRIFRASQPGIRKHLRSLQTLVLRGYANTLLGVWRVTQANRGTDMPDVDQLVVKTPEAMGRLVDQLLAQQPWTVRPAHRESISEAPGKRYTLGIPTIIERCLQVRIKNTPEPYWEAHFEGCSYGFRPGRGCYDAIAKIYLLAGPHPWKRWVVDADIKGAFDHIGHAFLLDTTGPFPGRELVKQWLTAGYADDGVFHDTPAGTGQGAVISPLLANIALHGMDAALGVRHDRKGQLCGPRAVVRYADVWVVFCESWTDAEQVIATMRDWLAERGLTFWEEKTRIVHLAQGFDFPGFSIRHYPARGPSRTGQKLLIKPSPASVQKLRDRLREIWLERRGDPVAALLHDPSPVIRGWANYFRIGVASDTFAALDSWMYTRAYRYAKFRHPKQPWAWRQRRYWGKLHPRRHDRWVFGDPQTGAYLLKFGWFPVCRHPLVRGTASLDDATLRGYWQRGTADYTAGQRAKVQRLAQRQRQVCPVCRQPRHQGGTDDDNLLLVHLYCHQPIHAGRGRHARARDERTSGFVRGLLEPDAANRHTSGSGRRERQQHSPLTRLGNWRHRSSCISGCFDGRGGTLTRRQPCAFSLPELER